MKYTITIEVTDRITPINRILNEIHDHLTEFGYTDSDTQLVRRIKFDSCLETGSDVPLTDTEKQTVIDHVFAVINESGTLSDPQLISFVESEE